MLSTDQLVHMRPLPPPFFSSTRQNRGSAPLLGLFKASSTAPATAEWCDTTASWLADVYASLKRTHEALTVLEDVQSPSSILQRFQLRMDVLIPLADSAQSSAAARVCRLDLCCPPQLPLILISLLLRHKPQSCCVTPRRTNRSCRTLAWRTTKLSRAFVASSCRSGTHWHSWRRRCAQ